MLEGLRPGYCPDRRFHTEGVTNAYDNGALKVRALAGVEITLYGKQISTLLGSSGAGKSTILNILDTLSHNILVVASVYATLGRSSPGASPATPRGCNRRNPPASCPACASSASPRAGSPRSSQERASCLPFSPSPWAGG